jgi:hypothetical protein
MLLILSVIWCPGVSAFSRFLLDTSWALYLRGCFKLHGTNRSVIAKQAPTICDRQPGSMRNGPQSDSITQSACFSQQEASCSRNHIPLLSNPIKQTAHSAQLKSADPPFSYSPSACDSYSIIFNTMFEMTLKRRKVNHLAGSVTFHAPMQYDAPR